MADSVGVGPQFDDVDTGKRLQPALAIAYRFLNRRDRTVAEMRRHLERRGCGSEEIGGAIELLEHQGYLDDGRFARLFAEDKRTLEQWGSERIRRELSARGIDRDAADAALAAAGVEGEFERAIALLRRRFPVPPRDLREHQRALGMLLRKGYSSELALDALRSFTDCADLLPVLRCR